ncbi:MAG: ribosome-associated translation inhibitor RaiA [Phycisphaerae bacterium]
MRIQITGRHVEVPDDVRDYIHEKVGRLPRFYDRIHDVEVVLDHESEQFTTEVIVRADRRQTFVARETGPDTFALVDLVVDKLERQLKRHKEKSRDHKHDGKTEPRPEL